VAPWGCGTRSHRTWASPSAWMRCTNCLARCPRWAPPGSACRSAGPPLAVRQRAHPLRAESGPPGGRDQPHRTDPETPRTPGQTERDRRDLPSRGLPTPTRPALGTTPRDPLVALPHHLDQRHRAAVPEEPPRPTRRWTDSQAPGRPMPQCHRLDPRPAVSDRMRRPHRWFAGARCAARATIGERFAQTGRERPCAAPLAACRGWDGCDRWYYPGSVGAWQRARRRRPVPGRGRPVYRRSPRVPEQGPVRPRVPRRSAARAPG